MNDDLVKVTICCMTYNHEKYIRKALEGFVMQKTNFKYKVIVHDDASTDNTAKIVKEFEKKYPNIIFPIYQAENQYSKSVPFFFKFILPLVDGDYIAMCEGDDFWTDEYKLQKQVDAMEKHPEIDMCVHGSTTYNVMENSYERTYFDKNYDYVISQRKTIFAGGGLVATCSILYRKELEYNIPKFRKYFDHDYAIQIHGSLRGGLLYLCDVMAVHNHGVEGSYSVKIFGDCEKNLNHSLKEMRMLDILNKETKYKYYLTIKLKILQLKKRKVQEYGIKEIKKANTDYYNNIGFISLMLIKILIFVTSFKNRIKRLLYR